MRLKYFLYFTVLLPLVFLLFSCSVGYIGLSVLHPSEIELNSGIQDVAVYNYIDSTTSRGYFDSVTDAQLDPETDYSKVRETYIKGIYETISESPRFSDVRLTDSTNRDDLTGNEINWPVIESICREDSVDALIVFKGDRNWDDLNIYSFFSYCYIYYKIMNDHNWSIYYPAGRLAYSFELKDTLRWEGTNDNCDFDIPQIYDLLSEACYYSGIRAGLYIAPYWEDNITRAVFTGGNNEMRQAAVLVSNDFWYDAGQIWNQLSLSGNRRLAAKASFNIALAYEHDDQLDQSLLWINYADSLSDNKHIENYKKILLERIKTKEILDRQMQVD